MMGLGMAMKDANKSAAADILFQAVASQESHSGFASWAKELLPAGIGSPDDYILGLGKQLFENVDKTGINKEAAIKYVDACEAFGLAYPGAEAPEKLFKAAEVAKSIKTYQKSLTLYDWILEKYPDYEKAATSLFLKGFIVENNLRDDKKARELYDEFLSRYPNHDLADDVEFLIENLGKSDQEILEMIEAKRKDK